MKNSRAKTIPYLLALLCFCSSLICIGQARTDTLINSNQKKSFYKRAHLGISAGFARPMGSFANSDDFTESSAYALSGFSLSILDFGYRIKDQFYLGGAYYLIQNGIEEENLSRNLVSQTGNSYQVTADEFELRVFMAGIGLTKRSNSLDIDLRFMGGYGSSFSPNFNIVETDQSTQARTDITIPTEKQSGLGGGLSFGLRVHLNESLDFSSKATYLIFQKDFEALNLSPGQLPSRLSYEVLSISFGFAYRFMPDIPPPNE